MVRLSDERASFGYAMHNVWCWDFWQDIVFMQVIPKN
jgi:hypothetical protein